MTTVTGVAERHDQSTPFSATTDPLVPFGDLTTQRGPDRSDRNAVRP